MKILFLNRYGRLGASSRLRSLQYLPVFTKSGLECFAVPLIDDAALALRYQKGTYGFFTLLKSYLQRIGQLLQRHRFDLVWIEKEPLPWLPAWMQQILLRGVPYLLDYDDAVFHNYDQHPSALVRRYYGRHIDRLMAGASLVVAGNGYLAQRARGAGAPLVEIVPTVIDLSRYKVKSLSTSGADSLRIVWIGSPSTVPYLQLLHEPLLALAKRFNFCLRVIGGEGLKMPGVELENLAWSEATEVAMIHSSDVGVMPLRDTAWERGKCGYKLIQYMACGLPVVASPVGVNREIVREGENGFLAATTDEWLSALTRLFADAALRRRLGEKGRRMVEENYCIERVAPRLVNLFRSIGRRN